MPTTSRPIDSGGFISAELKHAMVRLLRQTVGLLVTVVAVLGLVCHCPAQSQRYFTRHGVNIGCSPDAICTKIFSFLGCFGVAHVYSL